MSTITMRLEDAVARMHEGLGGAVCLDFANTLEPRGGPPPLDLPAGFTLRDELSSYDDLAGWAVHKGVLDPAGAEALIEAADRDPARPREMVDRAHALRDAIYRAFWAIAQDVSPARDDLAAIMAEYADAATHGTLVDTGGRIEWRWAEGAAELGRPLWPVARSAVDLLVNGARERIKVCPGPGRPPVSCAWLFYDTTKNGSRRWCSMADCGAATKIRLQAERRRATRNASRA